MRRFRLGEEIELYFTVEIHESPQLCGQVLLHRDLVIFLWCPQDFTAQSKGLKQASRIDFVVTELHQLAGNTADLLNGRVGATIFESARNTTCTEKWRNSVMMVDT
jgi:hypothetical protein